MFNSVDRQLTALINRMFDSFNDNAQQEGATNWLNCRVTTIVCCSYVLFYWYIQ